MHFIVGEKFAHFNALYSVNALDIFFQGELYLIISFR